MFSWIGKKKCVAQVHSACLTFFIIYPFHQVCGGGPHLALYHLRSLTPTNIYKTSTTTHKTVMYHNELVCMSTYCLIKYVFILTICFHWWGNGNSWITRVANFASSVCRFYLVGVTHLYIIGPSMEIWRRKCLVVPVLCTTSAPTLKLNITGYRENKSNIIIKRSMHYIIKWVKWWLGGTLLLTPFLFFRY